MLYPSRLLLAVTLGFLSGCMTQPTKQEPIADAAVEKQQQPVETVATEPKSMTEKSSDAMEQSVDIWVRMQHGFTLQGINSNRIDQQQAHLLNNKKGLERILGRARPYLFHILNETEARGIPGEIALLPAVESGFRPYAYSALGAAGLWQFMPATGKRYGLKQDWWLDARRDPVAATDAALTMLDRLQKQYNGDWLLALAAYNAGPGNVNRAIRRNEKKGLPTDYWSLKLPKETLAYVPRLLAYARIVREAALHQLALPNIDNEPYFTVAETGGQLDLNVASKLSGVPAEQLVALNSGYNRWATSPNGPHRIILPIENGETFKEQLAKLPESERLRWKMHKIKSGETLSHIARKYGLSVKVLQQTNKLKNSRIRAGKRLVIPLSESVTSVASLNRKHLPKNRMSYRVRKGDSLYRIAKRFRVKVADLRRWNSLNKRYLKPGERLTVLVDPARQTL